MTSAEEREPLPPSVSELLANRGKARARYPIQRPSYWRTSRVHTQSTSESPQSTQAHAWSILSRLSPWRPTTTTTTNTPALADTPSACLYRTYEFFVLGWTTAFRNELEYFCCTHPDWAVSALPDPADHTDPTRYAVLAVLTRLMCDAFNRRIERGLPRNAPPIILDFAELRARPKVYESPPEWAERVPALQDKVFIPDVEGKHMPEDDSEVSGEFKAMNIIAQMPHIHFV